MGENRCKKDPRLNRSCIFCDIFKECLKGTIKVCTSNNMFPCNHKCLLLKECSKIYKNAEIVMFNEDDIVKLLPKNKKLELQYNEIIKKLRYTKKVKIEMDGSKNG